MILLQQISFSNSVDKTNNIMNKNFKTNDIILLLLFFSIGFLYIFYYFICKYKYISDNNTSNKENNSKETNPQEKSNSYNSETKNVHKDKEENTSKETILQEKSNSYNNKTKNVHKDKEEDTSKETILQEKSNSYNNKTKNVHKDKEEDTSKETIPQERSNSYNNKTKNVHKDKEEDTSKETILQEKSNSYNNKTKNVHKDKEEDTSKETIPQERSNSYNNKTKNVHKDKEEDTSKKITLQEKSNHYNNETKNIHKDKEENTSKEINIALSETIKKLPQEKLKGLLEILKENNPYKGEHINKIIRNSSDDKKLIFFSKALSFIYSQKFFEEVIFDENYFNLFELYHFENSSTPKEITLNNTLGAKTTVVAEKLRESEASVFLALSNITGIGKSTLMKYCSMNWNKEGEKYITLKFKGSDISLLSKQFNEYINNKDKDGQYLILIDDFAGFSQNNSKWEENIVSFLDHAKQMKESSNCKFFITSNNENLLNKIDPKDTNFFNIDLNKINREELEEIYFFHYFAYLIEKRLTKLEMKNEKTNNISVKEFISKIIEDISSRIVTINTQQNDFNTENSLRNLGQTFATEIFAEEQSETNNKNIKEKSAVDFFKHHLRKRDLKSKTTTCLFNTNTIGKKIIRFLEKKLQGKKAIDQQKFTDSDFKIMIETIEKVSKSLFNKFSSSFKLKSTNKSKNKTIADDNELLVENILKLMKEFNDNHIIA